MFDITKQKDNALVGDYLIVGAGIAGLTAAETLSEHTPKAKIVLVNDEPREPYKRTKISKNIVSGFDRNQFALQPPAWYSDRGIKLYNGASVTNIDVKRQIATFDGHTDIGWDKLILATGATPSTPDEGGLHVPYFTVRNINDVELLRSAAVEAKSAVVVGMGVLGVEVSEQLCRLGIEVSLLGIDSRLMEKQLNSQAAYHLQSRFESCGVTLRFNTNVTSVRRNSSGAVHVQLEGGELSADMVVFCIGSKPDIRLAKKAGICTKLGVVVDEYLRTSHEHVYAAGDVAESQNGDVTHLWHAAEHQGRYAALNDAGLRKSRPSAFFRLKCEVFDQYYFSLNEGVSRHKEVISLEKQDPYRCFYLLENRLAGVVMVNDKDNAELYERAVGEGWSQKQLETSPLF